MSSQRRGPWSQAEDLYLCQLVHSQGALNWVRIAQMIGTRSPKQCRERYHQNLKPSLNHAPISAEEGALIERMVGEMGKRWADIARSLHGRSDNAVKNWWNGSMNRRRRIGTRQRHNSQEHNNNSYDQARPSVTFAQPQSNTHLTIQSPTYPPLRGMELPLHSPAGSEVSRTESYEGAPSLISDNGSAFSVSPRLHSSLVLERELAPIDTYRQDTYRRPSLPSLQYESRPIHVEGESVHRSYNMSVDEKIHFTGPYLQPPPYFRPEHSHGAAQQTPAPPPPPQQLILTAPSTPIQLPPLRFPSSARTASPGRDCRMNVTSLLS